MQSSKPIIKTTIVPCMDIHSFLTFLHISHLRMIHPGPQLGGTGAQSGYTFRDKIEENEKIKLRKRKKKKRRKKERKLT